MIVVIGESLVDLVPSGPDHVAVHCGGGPFNTARALARLGQPVSVLGAISLTASDALAVLPPRLDALVFGSLGLVLEPLAAAVTAVVQEAAAVRAALTVMDPNIRASLISDRDEYLERFARVLQWTDVVKASAEDLAWLDPAASAEEAAYGLLDRGARLVLVTRGAEGATVISAAGTAPIPAPRVTVADTIGAGDAFTAGFLAWWRHHGLGREQLGGLDLVTDAARFACEVAGRTVEQAGASPPVMSPPSAPRRPRVS